MYFPTCLPSRDRDAFQCLKTSWLCSHSTGMRTAAVKGRGITSWNISNLVSGKKQVVRYTSSFPVPMTPYSCITSSWRVHPAHFSVWRKGVFLWVRGCPLTGRERCHVRPPGLLRVWPRDDLLGWKGHCRCWAAEGAESRETLKGPVFANPPMTQGQMKQENQWQHISMWGVTPRKEIWVKKLQGDIIAQQGLTQSIY